MCTICLDTFVGYLLQVVIPEFNDCITIPVPKVDSWPSNPASMIDVIVEKNNRMYRLGTEQN
jgi:hypothetical protein